MVIGFLKTTNCIRADLSKSLRVRKRATERAKKINLTLNLSDNDGKDSTVFCRSSGPKKNRNDGRGANQRLYPGRKRRPDKLSMSQNQG